jgi:iron complex transport system permease protein
MKARTASRTTAGALTVLAVTGFLASLLLGPAATTPGDLRDFILHGDTTYAVIFIHLRLARACLAFLVGAALALSGAVLQGFFRNPMADPFVVGVSSGASFGAVLVLVLGIRTGAGFAVQGSAAFISGLIVVGAVYVLSRRKGVFKVETLLLTGIAAGALASSLTSFLLFMRADSFEQAVFWLLGSLASADWNQAAAVAPLILAGLAVAQALARDMNLLSLGDDTALALGCPVGHIRTIFLILATLLAALSVSVSGIIGFVGLIVPHWIRILTGPDHRRLFLLSSFAGGVFLVYCDLLARTVLAPAELPIGVITAAVGAPFFIYLLQRRRS